MKKLIAIMISSVLISACGGSHPLPSPAPPAPVPDTACGIATVSPTALSDGIRFIDPLNLSDAGGLSEHPSIASASGGKVYAAWDDDKNLDKDIFFRQSNDYGSSYQDIVNVSRTGVATFPSLAVGKNGTVHLAWQDLTTGPSEIRYSR